MAKPTGSLEKDAEVDGLYAQAPNEFVRARDELARRRKDEGQAEEAAAIKALRRPSVAAWAVNQVTRRWPGEVAELLAAAEELRRLQRRAASGVRAEGFQRATGRRRRAIAALARRASDVLAASGRHSPGASKAAWATFEAASVDEEAGDEVKAGRLTRELVASADFGRVGALDVVPSPAGGRTKGSRAGAGPASARRDAERRERAAAEARRAAMKARTDAERLAERATRLAAEADRARDLSAKAREESKAAQAVAAKAERAARRAEEAQP
jgi:hypothetical protein